MDFEKEINEQMAKIDSMLLSLGGMDIKDLLSDCSRQDKINVAILVLNADRDFSRAYKNGINVYYLSGEPELSVLKDVTAIGVYSSIELSPRVKLSVDSTLVTAMYVLNRYRALSKGCIVLNTPNEVSISP